MPFAITYPAKYEEEIIVNVPSDWSMDEGKDYVENDAFRLKARYDYGFRKVMLTYEYEAFQDHIPVEKTSEYLSALDSVDNNFSYSLSSDERKDASSELYTGKSKSNVSFYASLISLCVTGVLIWLLTRKKQAL